MSDDLIKESNVIYNYGVLTSRIFFLAIVFLISLFTYNGIYNRRLFYFSYVSSDYYLSYEVVLGIQMFYTAGGIPIVMGYDGFYTAMCINIVKQMKIVTHQFTNIINTTERHAELDKCIEHHSFLIE